MCTGRCRGQRWGCFGSRPLLVVIYFLSMQRALVPRPSAQVVWNHFNSLQLTSKAPPSPKPPWINVSSTMFQQITDVSPSFFESRLTEYFLHIYSIISILLFSPCLFPTSQDITGKPIPKGYMSNFLSYTCQYPFNHETSAKTCKPKSSFHSYQSHRIWAFLFACKQYIKRRGERGTAWLKDCRSSRTQPKC